MLDTDSRTECEIDQLGIYLNDECHYYQALKRLCVKVDFVTDESGHEQVVFDSGCFEDSQAGLFEHVKVGSYYNFKNQVSVEVRSSKDPYMIFAYTKYNLGTDFTVFWALALIFAILATISICMTISYCFQLKPRRSMNTQRLYSDPDMEVMHAVPVIEQ